MIPPAQNTQSFTASPSTNNKSHAFPPSKTLMFLKIFLVPILLIIGFFVWNYNSQTSVITVIGEGRAQAVPEIAKFALSISATGNSSEQALSNAKLKLASIRETLLANGVSEDGITTSTFSVSRAVTTPSDTLSLGYRATSAIGIESPDPANAENLVGNLLTTGVTLVAPPTYTTKDLESLEKKARDEAIEDAKRKGKEIAKKFRKRLGKMISFTDTSTQSQAGTAITKTTTDSQGTTFNQVEITRFVQVSFRGY